MKQGFELHQQARFGEAIPILDHACRLEPEDYFANLLLGIDLLRSGRAEESVPTWRWRRVPSQVRSFPTSISAKRVGSWVITQ
jgi:hypothetical protein